MHSPAIITLLIALAGALIIGIAPRPSQDAGAQDSSGVEDLPALFILDGDSGGTFGYNVDGELIDSEKYDDIIDFELPVLSFEPTALSVDYVTGVNEGDVFGASVVAADANSGFAFVSNGVINPSSDGFAFYIDFDEGDRLFTANLSRENDGRASKMFPARALDEIVVAHRGLFDSFTRVNVYQHQPNGPAQVEIGGFALLGASPEDIAIGDIGNPEGLLESEFKRFGQDGLAEIIVADPDTGLAKVYDPTGKEIPTDNFDLFYDDGDRILTGNVNGVGGEEILVARPDLGSVDVFDVRFGRELRLTKKHTILANFGPDDQIDLADINGNGTDEILIAQADSGGVTVHRYDLVEEAIVSEASLSVAYAPGDVFTALPIRYPDVDGDGLFDHWETEGVDVDGDGTVDIDLPGLGADPNHQDIFVEYDYVDGEEPSRASVQRVKAAFAAAPLLAGNRTNPDGETGINLWIDTGTLAEGGQLVGDNLGGGDEISQDEVPSEGTCGLDLTFDAVKDTHFNPLRTHVFRYGLSIADRQRTEDREGCDNGGQAELGGNDFVEHSNSDEGSADTIDEAATLMHELGHNLALHHGGFEPLNCKPNYISVMNYAYSGGIVQPDGFRIVDYAPARKPNGRTVKLLHGLPEISLVETLVLDSANATNYLTFSDATGDYVRRLPNDPIDWNGNGVIDQGQVSANINNLDSFEDCKNDVLSGRPFKDHNDWRNIILTVRNSESAAAGATVAPPFVEPSKQAIFELKQELNTTDLSISQVAEPDPAGAGAELTYTLTVTNHGPNPADTVQVIDTLPDGVTYKSSSASCSATEGEVSCDLDAIQVNDSREFTITVLVDAELGLNEPDTVFITNVATVSDPDDIAVDPDVANNTTTLETEVQIQSDLELVSFAPASTPVELVVGEPALIDFETTVANHGPFGPVTAVFDVVEPNAGPIIAGASSLVRADELAAGEERTLSGTVILTCSEPGIHDVAIVNSVGLREAEAVDPDPANNQAAAEISVECLVPVAINIKPGSETNPVNLNSQVPVALLTTTAGQYGIPIDIQATLIDPASIQFGARDVLLGVADPGGAAPRHSGGHFEDALELVDERTRDGDQDLILHFKAAESGLAAGDVEACLRATITLNRTDTMEVFGCDAVTIRP